MQYPASREARFVNTRVQFIDGSEQRYRTSSGVSKRWTILLRLLDDHEIHELEHFFNDCQGSYGSFVFVDPADGTEYSDCSLSQDEFAATAIDEMRHSATIVIVQNR
jgi:hypothetical protein